MLDNLPNIKHHTTNLLVVSSVNTVAQCLFSANYKGRFPEKTRVISDGISNGILCNAAINFADSFIYETSPPICKAATYAIGMCLSLELSNTMNDYTGIKLKQEEAEKLSEMTIYGVRYFIKPFLYFLVCHKDIDEIYGLCDGVLMNTVLSGITGDIAYSITSPALYNNEDIYENKSIFVVMARSSDFWDGFRISAAYNINY